MRQSEVLLSHRWPDSRVRTYKTEMARTLLDGRASDLLAMRRSGSAAVVAVAVMFAASSVGAASRVGATPLGDPLTLEACLAAADSTNPSLLAAWHKWQAAVGASRGAGSLPDPMFTYGYFITPVETRVGPQEDRLGLRQTLPWFGKLRLKREAATAGADAWYQRYRRAAADAEYEVTAAFADYANLRITTDILERRAALLSDLESAVRARYSAGDAPYADLMRAGIERARVEDRLAAARNRRSPASARLAAAIGIEPGRPLPWPDDIPTVEAPALGDGAGGPSDLSPEVLMLDSETTKAERARSLARRGYFPDLTIGVDYIVTGEAAMPVDDSGKDPLSVSASVGVPLWFGKHAAAVREQTERLAAARQTRRQKENELSAKLEMALYDVDDARRRVALYANEILPDAEASLASARAAYASGDLSFDSVVAAEQTALEMELAMETARVDAALAAAGLRRLLAAGTPVEPVRDHRSR